MFVKLEGQRAVSYIEKETSLNQIQYGPGKAYVTEGQLCLELCNGME